MYHVSCCHDAGRGRDRSAVELPPGRGQDELHRQCGRRCQDHGGLRQGHTHTQPSNVIMVSQTFKGDGQRLIHNHKYNFGLYSQLFKKLLTVTVTYDFRALVFVL